MNARTVQTFTFELTKDNTTGWTSAVAMPNFGREGRIVHVQVREDDTDADANRCDVVIADHDFATAPPDDDRFYQTGGIALNGSATDASLVHNVAAVGGAFYRVHDLGDLRLAADITATSGQGDTKLYVTVRAEVWG